MKDTWLAIDTATAVASVAAVHADATERFGDATERFVGASDILKGARLHASHLLPLIDRVLVTVDRGVGDLQGIVIGDGPGSFTGLRVGWATAKGLAQEAGLPVVAIPSLMGKAHSASQTLGEPIAVCYDALRGAVYGAVYRFAESQVETLLPPRVGTIEEMAEHSPVRPSFALGDGALRYAAEIRAWTGREPLNWDQEAAQGEVGIVAWSFLVLKDKVGATRVIDDLASGEPVYGRPAEAQARWEARHGRPLPDPSRAAR